jgi:hypothetical protein
MSANDPAGRRYRFDGCSFRRVRAHGGARDPFARVLSRSRGPLRFVVSVLPPQSDIGCHTHEPTTRAVSSWRAGPQTLDGQEFEVGSATSSPTPRRNPRLRNIGQEELRIVVIEVDAR